MSDALNSRVARFETNEGNVDRWVKGDQTTSIDFGGGAVRTPAKLIYDLDSFIKAIATQTVADYAGLRAYSGTAQMLQVTGYLATAKPAGIAGRFTRDDNDKTSADDGGTIIVAANGVRWKRTFDGAANILWFGADPGGVLDSTPAFALALAWQAASGAFIEMPAGTFLLNGQLQYTVALKLRGAGMDKTILKCQFAGGPTFVASGANVHMPGTVLERFQANGLGATGTGEIFFKSQTAESNRNGVFRDLQLTRFDKAGLMVSDSYDCFFQNLRLWFMGDGTTHGHGILLDRVTWPVGNSYATTGNTYENISCMNSYRGIGVTTGNQICYSDFKHITGEFCDYTIETYLGSTAPTSGWIGGNSFTRVYSESNLTGGIRSFNGTEVECRAAAYTGGGNNQPNYGSNFTRLLNGLLSVGGAGTANPTVQFTDGNSTLMGSISYILSLKRLHFLSQNAQPMFVLNDGPAQGGSSYAMLQLPESAGQAKLFFGQGTGAFVDYGISQAAGFTFTGGAGTTGKTWFKTGISLLSNKSIGTATLVAGVVTVNTTAVTANSKIVATINTPGGTPGYVYVPAADIVAGTSFKIHSTSATDTSTVNWLIIDAQ